MNESIEENKARALNFALDKIYNVAPAATLRIPKENNMCDASKTALGRKISEWREQDLPSLIIEALTELRGIKTTLQLIGVYLRPEIKMRTEIGEMDAETIRAIRREIADQEAEELEHRHIASQEAACGDTDKD